MMFKFVLILVPLVAVCEAEVARVFMVATPEFDVKFHPSHHPKESVKVFCAKGYVIQCVDTDSLQTFIFTDREAPGGRWYVYNGKSGAYIYYHSTCTQNRIPDDKLVSYALMDDCNDIRASTIKSYMPENHFRADGSKIEIRHFVEAPVRKSIKTGLTLFEVCLTDRFDPKPGEKLGVSCIVLEKPHIGRSPAAKTDWTAWTENCGRGAYSCTSCTTGRICAPTTDGKQFYEINRFDCTALYPYCDYKTGTCSSSPDPACFELSDTEESPNFICMRDGFYPHPKSCTKFYICKNKTPYEHTCPENPTPYYHPRLRHCIATKDFCAAETSATFCENKENLGRKVPVLFTNSYFMYCGINQNVLTVDRCIGDYFYDPVSQGCKFVCPHEGVFLSMEDCAKYIRCSPKPQGGFARTDVDCPNGQAFLESEYACVDRSRVPNCNAHPDAYSK